MAYSDDPLAFKKDLLDAFYEALSNVALSGGTIKVSKGDYASTYMTASDIQKQIDRIENEITLEETDTDFWCNRRC